MTNRRFQAHPIRVESGPTRSRFERVDNLLAILLVNVIAIYFLAHVIASTFLCPTPAAGAEPSQMPGPFPRGSIDPSASPWIPSPQPHSTPATPTITLPPTDTEEAR